MAYNPRKNLGIYGCGKILKALGGPAHVIAICSVSLFSTGSFAHEKLGGNVCSCKDCGCKLRYSTSSKDILKCPNCGSENVKCYSKFDYLLRPKSEEILDELRK